MVFFNDYYYYFLLFAVVLVLFHLILQKKRNLPPSPLSLPLIGHLYLLKRPLHETLENISTQIGPILYLHFGSRPVLIVSSASAAEECFTKNDIIFANRPKLLAGKQLGYNFTSLAWAPYGPHWRNLRRITTLEIFSSNRLMMLSEIRVDELRLMVQRLVRGSFNEGYRTINMKSTFFELTLNIMMRMIAGKRYYGENVEEVDKAERFREFITETVFLSGASNLGDYIPVLNWVGFKDIEKRMLKLKRKRDNFFQELIEEYRRSCYNREGKKTMLDVLLSLQEQEPEYYTDEMIRSIITVLLNAGTETSIGTMEWAMSLLLNHPLVLARAKAEINDHVGNSRLLNEYDLAKFPYLHRIIMETLRMYPAAPLLLPHESSKECTIGGFDVPRGTMLLVNMWAIQNDPKTWEKPREFKPERFEGIEGGRDGFKFMPFGSGRRGCPGEGLAMRMVGLTLGTLIQCFEWERSGEEMVDMSEGIGATMPKAKPLEAKCRPCPTMVKILSLL